MASIDERIVQMEFDNKQFEQGLGTSLKSLEQLDSRIKGLDNSHALSGISSAVQNISDRFSTLGIIGMTALQNITNQAIQAGQRVLTALTVRPMIDGFREYETQIQAIRVMQANLGAEFNMDKVNAALDNLNEYADRTIYNFGQMTQGIGRFTAAGVNLEDSVNTIKGLANVAAGAGTNAEALARTYIQVSQALQRGYFMLQDWNSLTNAQMGNVEMQNNLMKTAEAMGIVVNREKGFRDSLKDGWLTTEVFVETMKWASDETTAWGQRLFTAATQVDTFTKLVGTLAEAMGSGWAQSMELIIGDYTQAVALWTEASNVLSGMISATADARNEMLKMWADAGGRIDIIEAVLHALDAVNAIIDPIRKAFESVFPPLTWERLKQFTEGIRDFTRSFKISGSTLQAIHNIFKGLFSAVDIGIQVFKTLGSMFGSVLDALSPLGGLLLSAAGGIGNFITAIRNLATESGFFVKVAEGFSNAMVTVKETFTGFSNVIRESKLFASIAEILTEVAIAAGIGISDLGRNIYNGLVEAFRVAREAIDSFIRKVSEIDLNVFEGFRNAIEKIKESLQNVSTLTNPIASFFDGIKAVFARIVPYLQKIAQFFKDVFGGIAREIQTAFNSGDFSRIAEVLETGLFASIIILIDRFLIKLGDLFGNAASVTKGFGDIIDGIAGPLKAFEQSIRADAIMKIATAIGILVASLVVLSMINEEKLASAVAAISFMFGELQLAMRVFGKTFDPMTVKTISSGTLSMIGISAAVLILSSALIKLSTIDMDQLITGLIGLAGIFTTLSLFISKTSFGVGMAQSARAIQTLAVAILALSLGVKLMGSMDMGTLIKGLGGIAVGLATMAAVLISIDGLSSSITKGASAILVISSALIVFSASVAILGNLKVETLQRGLGSIVIGLAGMAAVLVVLDKLSPSITKGAASIFILAASLNLLVAPIGILGALPWEVVKKGLGSALVGLAGMMAVLIGLSTLENSTLKAAASITIMAVALNMLIVPITALGLLPIKVIAVGLGTIVVALGAFVVAAKLLAPLSPAILAIGAALALMGVAAVGFGVGVTMAVAALIAFAAAWAATSVAILAAITGIVVGVAALIPQVAAKIAEGIVTFAKVVSDGAPIIGQAFYNIVVTVLETISALIPKIIEIFYTLMESILDVMIAHGPKFVDTVVGFISMLLETLDRNLPVIINRLIVFIVNAVNTIALEIDRNGPALIEAVKNIWIAILNMCIEMLAAIVEEIPGFGKKIADEVRSWKLTIETELAPAQFRQIGEDVGGSIVSGFSSKEPQLAAAAARYAAIILRTKDAMGDFEAGIGTVLADDTFINAQYEREAYNKAFEDAVDANYEEARKRAQVADLYRDTIGKTTIEATGQYEEAYAAAEKQRDMNQEAVYEMDERIRVEKELAKTQQQRNRVENVLTNGDYSAAAKEVVKTLTNIPGIDFSDWAAKDRLADALKIGGVGEEEGQQIMEDLAGGMEMGIPEVAGAAGKAGGAAKEAIQGQALEFKDLGRQTVDDYLSGIREMGDMLKASVEKAFATDEQTAANIVATLDQAIEDIEARVMTIYDAASDRFGKLSTESETSVREMIENLKHNQMVIADWADGIALLAERGLNEGLLEQLRNAGPASAGEVRALVSATDTELQQLGTLFNNSGAVAVNALVTSMSGAGPQLQLEGANMVQALASGLTSSTAVNDAMAIVINGATGVGTTKIPEFKTIGTESNNAFNSGLSNEEQLLFTTQAGTEVADAAEEGISSNEQVFANQGRTDGLGFQRELRNTESQAESAGRVVGGAAEDGVKENIDEFYDAGQEAGESFIKGLESKIDEAREAGSKLSRAAAGGVRSGIDMNSPSKVLIADGSLAGISFAMGLIDAIPVVERAGENLSQATVTGMETLINTLQMLMFDEIDMTPTIRPVIDMTDMQAGIAQMNRLFGARTINTDGFAVEALKVASQFAPVHTIQEPISRVETETEPRQFIQNNYSPKALDRLTIYRQTNNLLAQSRMVVNKR